MDAKTVRHFLDYSPVTGNLLWNYALPIYFTASARSAAQKARMFNARYAGRDAFTSVNGNGYRDGKFRGSQVTAHRVIWLWVNGSLPEGQIDHINGNRTDNRIKNLRDVSSKENSRNLSISSRNNSGVVGVRLNKPRGRWEADIRVDGRLIFLGRFKLFEDAIAARERANVKYGFHKNHGKR